MSAQYEFIHATPELFTRAASLLNNLIWTDYQLVEVILGLECVIPWLEGANYGFWVISPLRQELDRFRKMQDKRKEQRSKCSNGIQCGTALY